MKKRNKCNYGGDLSPLLNIVPMNDTVKTTASMALQGSTFGPAGALVGGAIGLATALKNKSQMANTVTFGSPGSYNLGGSIMEVPGNPKEIDTKKYNYKGAEIFLTPSEVVDTNSDFVYTSAVHNPVTGNKFSSDAKRLGMMRERLGNKAAYSNDKISAGTDKIVNSFEDSLKAMQLLMTSSKVSNRYYKGGPIYDPNVKSFQNWYNTRIASINNLPPIVEDGIAGKVTKPLMAKYKNYSNPNVKYVPSPTAIGESAPQQVDNLGVVTNPVSQRMQELPPLPNIGDNKIPRLPASFSVVQNTSGTSSRGDFYQKIAPFLSALTLAGGPEKEAANLNLTPITKQSFDPTSQYYQSDRNFRNQVANIDGVSANQRRAIQNALYAQKLNLDSQTTERYQDLNNQATTNYESRLGARASENIASINYTNNINAANRGAYNNAYQTTLQTLSNYGKSLNERNYGNRRLDILKMLYPDGFKSYYNG